MDMFETKPTGPETTPGPRVRSEVYISPETVIELYLFGTGVGLRIGEFWESYVYIGLGWDAASRHDACERLIAVLTAARDWEPEPEAVPA